MLKTILLLIFLLPFMAEAQFAFSPRVVGGNDASLDQAPFIVSLRDSGDNHFCGGTLVSPEWVVTAAHCIIFGEVPDHISANSVGIIHDQNTKTFKVVDVIVHPDFLQNIQKGQMGSDIALLKIEPYLDASVAALNTTEVSVLANSDFQITGWGLLSEFGGQTSVLQIANIPYVDSATCEAQLQEEKPETVLDETMFCAGYPQGGVDSCQGDSGGPLFTYSNGDFVLVGIVSWGFGCARPNSPGVYADISQLSDWIADAIE